MPALEAQTPLAKEIASLKSGSSKTIKELMKGRADVYKLNPFDIQIEPGFNARDVSSPKVQEHIDCLALSIANIGLQRPIKVQMRNGKAKLIDGECRLRAVIRAIEVHGAEIRTVDAILANKTLSDAEATLALVVDNGGLDLNALEKAQAFKRLDAFGWSRKEIAEKSGYTEARVGQLIELAGVPDDLKAMIKGDEISSTLAWSIAKENDFDAEATMTCVKAALAEAQSKGRVKVTARSVAGSRMSIKSTVSTILRAADVAEDTEEDGTGMVIVSFARADWDTLQQALKLNLL